MFRVCRAVGPSDGRHLRAATTDRAKGGARHLGRDGARCLGHHGARRLGHKRARRGEQASKRLLYYCLMDSQQIVGYERYGVACRTACATASGASSPPRKISASATRHLIGRRVVFTGTLAKHLQGPGSHRSTAAPRPHEPPRPPRPPPQALERRRAPPACLPTSTATGAGAAARHVERAGCVGRVVGTASGALPPPQTLGPAARGGGPPLSTAPARLPPPPPVRALRPRCPSWSGAILCCSLSLFTPSPPCSWHPLSTVGRGWQAVTRGKARGPRSTGRGWRFHAAGGARWRCRRCTWSRR